MYCVGNLKFVGRGNKNNNETVYNTYAHIMI